MSETRSAVVRCGRCASETAIAYDLSIYIVQSNLGVRVPSPPAIHCNDICQSCVDMLSSAVEGWKHHGSRCPSELRDQRR